MNLPSEMPEGCNFYSVVILAGDRAKAILDSFTGAGWSVETTPEAIILTTGWARLTTNTVKKNAHENFVLSGWIDSIDAHTGEILGILQQSKLRIESQWIGDDGDLWREIPFDERMIESDDVRLPGEIKSELRKNLPRSRQSARPWWRFW